MIAQKKTGPTKTTNQAEASGCLYWCNPTTGEQWFNWPMIETAAANPKDEKHMMGRMLAAARAEGVQK